MYRILKKIYNTVPMPAVLRNNIRLIYWAWKSPQDADINQYQLRVDQEVNRFSEDVNIHDLPDIFHYWSNKYLLPMFKEMGIKGINELFAEAVISAIKKDVESGRNRQCHVVSMGSGNCDVEVEVAKVLKSRGVESYVIECIDIVPDMLDRGRELAASQCLDDKFLFTRADCNSWQPEESSVDIVIAHQSLHHFVDLEVLFDKIQLAIGDTGVFVTSDIIGRNGHMRWPEAERRIDEIWQDMPDRYKYNHMLKRTEKTYENWDCSTVGFEGIRAQDILPLLLERFRFDMFLGYGNLTDIFIDRAFGHNFDVNNQEDLGFIDKVSMMDQVLLESGELKPTHIIAIMSNRQNVDGGRYYKNLSPEFCVRPVD